MQVTILRGRFAVCRKMSPLVLIGRVQALLSANIYQNSIFDLDVLYLLNQILNFDEYLIIEQALIYLSTCRQNGHLFSGRAPPLLRYAKRGLEQIRDTGLRTFERP